MAERLLELRNSDPELFSEAWKKIPPSTQDNIIAYLRKHGGEDQVSKTSHSNFEDKSSHSKHKMPEHPLEPVRLEHREEKLSSTPSSLVEAHKTSPSPNRPLYEWTDGELLAHTLLDSEVREGFDHGKTSPDAATELRRLSKQNMVQIVQNELIRRLLQTIAGKA